MNDRDNALQLNAQAKHITESYIISPGPCICEHRLTHHSPAAFGRHCEVCECVLFTSSLGVKPHREAHFGNHYRKLPETIDGMIELSLSWQALSTSRLAQAAIERLYERPTK